MFNTGFFVQSNVLRDLQLQVASIVNDTASTGLDVAAVESYLKTRLHPLALDKQAELVVVDDLVQAQQDGDARYVHSTDATAGGLWPSYPVISTRINNCASSESVERLATEGKWGVNQTLALTSQIPDVSGLALQSALNTTNQSLGTLSDSVTTLRGNKFCTGLVSNGFGLTSTTVNSYTPYWAQWSDAQGSVGSDCGGARVTWSIQSNNTPFTFSAGVFTNGDTIAHTIVVGFTMFALTTANQWDIWIQSGSTNNAASRVAYAGGPSNTQLGLFCSCTLDVDPGGTWSTWARVFNAASQTCRGGRIRFHMIK